MKIEINLASYDFRQVRRIRMFLSLLSILLVVLGSFQVWDYLSYEKEREYLRQSLAKVQESQNTLENELRTRGLSATNAGLTAFREKINSLNQFIVQRSFSWTLLLNELESSVPKNISIKRIKPRFPSGMIAVDGQGLGLKDLTQLMVRLENSPVFEEVFLKKQYINREGFVEFILEFRYRPA